MSSNNNNNKNQSKKNFSNVDRVPSSPQDQPQPDANFHSLTFAVQNCQNTDEKTHWDDVCRSYRQYSVFAVKQFGLNHPARLANVPTLLLPRHLQVNTPEYMQRLSKYKEAAIRNQFCLDCILRHAGQAHSQQKLTDSFSSEHQLSKVCSVLKSLARDWSVEGKVERDTAYLPLIQSVLKYLPIPNNKKQKPAAPIKLCVPGAGLGRLACELAAKRYTVQGNEFSLFMLLASDFILNGPLVSTNNTAGKQPLMISPWLLETRNVSRSADPYRSVAIPDVDPYQLVGGGNGEGADFSMAAGDFLSIYGEQKEHNVWDGVVAAFFLDACPNIVKVLQVVHDMLKPGGMLFSFGPLHWHWSGPAMQLSDTSVEDYQSRYSNLDENYLNSVDLCWEDVQVILQNIGFEMVEVRTNLPAHYTADQASMLRTEYRCVHFCARKKLNAKTKKKK